MSKVQNKYALISVSDKSNIEDIARSLVDLGYTILSTGGTAKYLTSMSIPNVSVSDFTEFEEILGGRVKLLFSGSAPIDKSVLDFMMAVFCVPFGEGYGLSESCA